jgi:hypothetical protein
MVALWIASHGRLKLWGNPVGARLFRPLLRHLKPPPMAALWGAFCIRQCHPLPEGNAASTRRLLMHLECVSACKVARVRATNARRRRAGRRTGRFAPRWKAGRRALLLKCDQDSGRTTVEGRLCEDRTTANADAALCHYRLWSLERRSACDRKEALPDVSGFTFATPFLGLSLGKRLPARTKSLYKLLLPAVGGRKRCMIT